MIQMVREFFSYFRAAPSRGDYIMIKREKIYLEAEVVYKSQMNLLVVFTERNKTCYKEVPNEGQILSKKKPYDFILFIILLFVIFLFFCSIRATKCSSNWFSNLFNFNFNVFSFFQLV